VGQEPKSGSTGPGIAAAGEISAPIDWARTDLYRFFAAVFGPPSQRCFDFLAQPDMAGALGELWRQLECQGEFPGFEWFGSYELYESAYIALFDVGMPEPPVALFESAHDKTRPAQEIALENTFFYEVLGLKADPTRVVPDYLITQLEFLAAVRFTEENASDASTAESMARARSDFLERHLLNWVPGAEAKLSRTEAPGFPVLMALLLRFLRREQEAAAPGPA
jgi:DMSO reductase family type II enzyme chaperone